MAAGKLIALAIIGLLFPIAAHGEQKDCTSISTGGVKTCNFTLAKGDTMKLDCSANKGHVVPDTLLGDAPEVCWNEAGTLQDKLGFTCDKAAVKKLSEFASQKIVTESPGADGFTIKNDGYSGEKKLILQGVCADAGKQNGVVFNVTLEPPSKSPDSSGAVGGTSSIGLAAASAVALLGLSAAL